MPANARSRLLTPRGHAYLLLLIAIAVIGGAAAASISLGAAIARRDAERELLAIGLEFQQALRSHAAARGAGPRTLNELLKDPAAPGVRRHLRQVYADPLTGRAEWGTVRDSQNRIVGIHSVATGIPLQRTGFATELSALEDAPSYREWLFGLTQAPPPKK